MSRIDPEWSATEPFVGMAFVWDWDPDARSRRVVRPALDVVSFVFADDHDIKTGVDLIGRDYFAEHARPLKTTVSGGRAAERPGSVPVCPSPAREPSAAPPVSKEHT